MTINEWDTQPIPRSTVLWVIHEYILVPFDSLNPRFFSWKWGHQFGGPSVEPLCPPRIEWVSPPLSELPWVQGGGCNPVSSNHCFHPGLKTFAFWGCFSHGLGLPDLGFCLLGHSQAQWPPFLQYAHWSFSRGFLSLFGWSLSPLLSLTTVAKILCKFLSFHFSFSHLPFIFVLSLSLLLLLLCLPVMVDFLSNLH